MLYLHPAIFTTEQITGEDFVFVKCGVALSVFLSTTMFVIKDVKTLWTHEAHNILTTLTTNIVLDKNTDNAEPHSICFLPQYSEPRKMFISECAEDRNTKKEQALSISYSRDDHCLFPDTYLHLI